MKSHIYTHLENSILKEWENLWKSSPYATVYNSPWWFIAATQTYTYTQKRIVVILDNNQLIAIVGLVQSTLHGIPVWTIPAYEFANKDPFLFLKLNNVLIDTFTQKVQSLGTVTLPHCSSQLTKHLCSTAYARTIYMQMSPTIAITRNPYGNFSVKKISLLTNRLKKLGKEVTVKTYKGNNKALKTAFTIDGKSSRALHGKGVFIRTDVKKFYITLAKIAPHLVITHLLYFGTTPVAYSIGFTYHKTFEGSQKAHLPGCNYFKPGQVLLLRILELLKKQNIQHVLLGLGNDMFKSDFTKDYESLATVLLTKNYLFSTYVQTAHTIRESIYTHVVHTKAYVAYKQFFAQKNNK